MTFERMLQSIQIKTRLRVFFSSVVVLMLLGSALGLWQFRNLSAQAMRVSRSEQRISALLRLENNLLNLVSRLHRSADQRDAAQFESEANRLIAAFTQQSDESRDDLQELARQGGRYEVRVGTIESMLDGMPARVGILIQLARQNDWIALEARLLNQSDRTDDVVTALVDQAEADLRVERQRLRDDLARTQRRAANMLALTALLSLVVAGILGTLLTHSITRPLSDLAFGTRALAAGQFSHRVPVGGNDELAHLAKAFNGTAGDLSRLFEQVQQERAAAEGARTSLERQAQELARANADLQQFAYSASHDLQEPIRTVSLYSQLLKRRYGEKLDQSGQEYMGYLLWGAGHMQQLITDLLAYSQVTAVDNNDDSNLRADVGVVLDHVLCALASEIRRHGCTVTADPLPRVRAREIHVQQLLQNLIGNAVKYRGDRRPQIHVSAEAREADWLLSVRDNGIGIDPRYTQTIFGMFKRLHGQEYPGTGIGLAICQRIVERYGGRIWVESRLGEGSTFWFTLPRLQADNGSR